MVTLLSEWAECTKRVRAVEPGNWNRRFSGRPDESSGCRHICIILYIYNHKCVYNGGYTRSAKSGGDCQVEAGAGSVEQ